MSGVAAIRRLRREQANSLRRERKTKAEYADVMRRAAQSALLHPMCSDEMRDNANEMLEMVGDMLEAPRFGWYPTRPKAWRP